MINFKRLNHLQICIPVGKEDEARKFYTDIIRPFCILLETALNSWSKII